MRSFNVRPGAYSSVATHPQAVEMEGDECLISDLRGRIRPVDAVERKLQNALRQVDASRKAPIPFDVT